MDTIDDLNGRFALPGVAQFESGRGGLIRLAVSAPVSEGHVYLHGAHVTHFHAAGQGPVLFLSEKSSFEAQKPIRGGVPVIFPWFGQRQDGEGPMHGLVRTREWSVREVKQADDAVRATFSISSDDQTRAAWPHEFELRFSVTFGRSLEMELEVHNRSPRHFRFEEALHTYLGVGDVRQVSLEGLGGTDFVDKNLGFERRTQDEAILKLTGPTDRVYTGTTETCVVRDPLNRRRITIAKKNSASTVVWNPWQDQIAKIADLDAQDWPRFLCVETCNVREQAIDLAPGARHALRAIVTAEAD